jgi:hypothetical protein
VQLHQLIVSLLVLVLSSCHLLKSKPTYTYTLQEIVSLEAVDLSEDRSLLSTHNDEIVVCYYWLDTARNNFVYLAKKSELIVFDSLYVRHPLNLRLFPATIPSTPHLLVCLVELDEDGTETHILNSLQKFIHQQPLEKLDSKVAVDMVLGDNDFLGYVVLPFTSTAIDTTYIISGSHMLDEYWYNLTVKKERP